MAKATTTTTSRKPKAPAVTPIQVTHTLATAKPTSCGDAFTVLSEAFSPTVAATYAAEGCKRLPRHEVTELKGHKAEKPLGLLTSAQRKARIAAKASKPKAAKAVKVASKLVTVGGTKFRVFENGKVEAVTVGDGASVAEVVAAGDAIAGVTRRSAKPKVRQLPMADSPRRVAAPAPRTKRARTAKPSGQPSAVLA